MSAQGKALTKSCYINASFLFKNGGNCPAGTVREEGYVQGEFPDPQARVICLQMASRLLSGVIEESAVMSSAIRGHGRGHVPPYTFNKITHRQNHITITTTKGKAYTIM